MADQVKAPPVKKQNKNAFGNIKKPDVVIYQSVFPNDVAMRTDTEMYPPYHRFPNTDLISWNWGTDEEPDWRERAIRWLPGYQSIFVDEQEKDGHVVPKALLDNSAHSNKFVLVKGRIVVRPHEKTKQQFLDICNRNINSKHRTGRVQGIFEKYSEDSKIDTLSTRQEMQQEAIDKAFSASEDQIAFHAKYLGVPMIDSATSSSRTFKAVRADYRQMAINDPERFLKTFDDDDLRLKYFIGKAIEDNLVNLNLIPGKIIWTATKEEVCDIPAGSTAIESLFNFCQLKAGEDTLRRIKEHNK